MFDTENDPNGKGPIHWVGGKAVQGDGFTIKNLWRDNEVVFGPGYEAPKDKPTNPKDGIGVTKLALHLVSPVVKAYQAVAHFLGVTKYGAWNYRDSGARASVYLSALHRHIDAWAEGEDLDPADGTPHLANALACIGILIDAKHCSKLVDDRQPSCPEYRKVVAEMEAIMAALAAKYADRAPKHFTIADTK